MLKTTISRSSLAAQLAQFFRRHPNEWVDARDLLAVAGFAGWRGRISEIRRPPYDLHIRNRQRRVKRPDGDLVISEYMNVVEPSTAPTTTKEESAGRTGARTSALPLFR
jgi:hypothetical protein